MDAVALAQSLIRQPSVTPAKGDSAEILAQKNAALLACFDVLEAPLKKLGFQCHRVVFEEPGFPAIPNFYAEYNGGGKHLNFLGHVDVVPPGDLSAWTQKPFGGDIVSGVLYGRGASDMKGNIASFVAALPEFLAAKPKATISLLITGDEESYAVNGIPKMIPWLQQRGVKFDYCLVGEPSNPMRLGEEIKNGRRGTVNGHAIIHGTQGHIAYPDRFDNPVTRLGRFIAACGGKDLDAGNEYFEPSRLEVNIIDLPNRTTNVIPGKVSFGFNVRWNNLWTRDRLDKKIRALCAEHLGKHDLELDFSGGVYLTQKGPFLSAITDSVREVTGTSPRCTTGGGTSDGRFVAAICPEVAECGVTSATIHQVDECVTAEDLKNLARIYAGILRRMFA